MVTWNQSNENREKMNYESWSFSPSCLMRQSTTLNHSDRIEFKRLHKLFRCTWNRIIDMDFIDKEQAYNNRVYAKLTFYGQFSLYPDINYVKNISRHGTETAAPLTKRESIFYFTV